MSAGVQPQTFNFQLRIDVEPVGEHLLLQREALHIELSVVVERAIKGAMDSRAEHLPGVSLVQVICLPRA